MPQPVEHASCGDADPQDRAVVDVQSLDHQGAAASPIAACRCVSMTSEAVTTTLGNQQQTRVIPAAVAHDPGVVWTQSQPASRSCLITLPPALASSVTTAPSTVVREAVFDATTSQQRLASPPRVVSLTRPAVAVTDSCTLSPALQAWIHCLIDQKLEIGLQKGREAVPPPISEGDGRKQPNDLQPLQRRVDSMEVQLRNVADEKDRLLAIVERMSVEADRRYDMWDQLKGEHSVQMETVNAMLLDVQRKVDRGIAELGAKLSRHEMDMAELHRLVTTEVARCDAIMVDLRRSVSDFMETCEKLSEMNGETRVAVRSVQNDLAALDEQLWRTDSRLGQRISELAVSQEHVLASTASLEQSQQRLAVHLAKVSREVRLNSDDLSCISPVPVDVRVDNSAADPGLRATSPVQVPVAPGGVVHISTPSWNFPHAESGLTEAAVMCDGMTVGSTDEALHWRLPPGR